MKKILFVFCLILLFVAGFYTPAFAVTQEDFNLTILKDNIPVREFAGEVAIPFDTEYKLRLKNNNPRRCSVTVYIDGAKVSEIGDFIIDGNDSLDLERFLNDSLTEGRRFKFVPLDHPDVDDPNRLENGMVKVEFRLEKVLYIQQSTPKYFWPEDQYPDLIIELTPGDDWVIDGDTLTMPILDSNDYTIDLMDSMVSCSNTSAGATVPGSYSDQSFHKVEFDAEDKTVTIQLRMVGI